MESGKSDLSKEDELLFVPVDKSQQAPEVAPLLVGPRSAGFAGCNVALDSSGASVLASALVECSMPNNGKSLAWKYVVFACLCNGMPAD